LLSPQVDDRVSQLFGRVKRKMISKVREW
jgi:hypothetical protein